MKLISWNVNGLRAVMSKDTLLPFIAAEDPDIMAFQETKMQEEQMEFNFDGYLRYMNSAEKKGYSGTMVLTKKKPLNVIYDIEGEDHPKEGRVITLEYEDFFFVCAYVPNSKDGLKRIDYRMHWEDDLRAHLMKLDKIKPVIYTGDLNVAHNEIDLKNPDDNHFSAGFSDEERGKFNELLAAGFADSFRELYPEKVKYSWWSYRTRARERDAGWRIDYFVVSRRLMKDVKDSLIYNEIMGSDHCPVGLIL
ncbi:MAG: exodeoxyribonuclease III [Erysipelotrichaceae bacterium]|nr:exodeoxyribonuclease III [Erysipelotrichaceae bacterium]MBQ2232865.1 exodeoxyribonuclease III [Erysipelotrichaceae bacterium]MBQ3962375.1 exodeoxyribonuclease III [Erysipelotrichaceae bacterium]MBQ5556126.1 exodeoxyribonuclease III [Erysipelotrichaceae bacterium]MEE3425071.1 exodeoxyribonuclease III [Erysipelotrichaceae bacterium]